MRQTKTLKKAPPTTTLSSMDLEYRMKPSQTAVDSKLRKTSVLVISRSRAMNSKRFLLGIVIDLLWSQFDLKSSSIRKVDPVK